MRRIVLRDKIRRRGRRFDVSINVDAKYWQDELDRLIDRMDSSGQNHTRIGPFFVALHKQ